MDGDQSMMNCHSQLPSVLDKIIEMAKEELNYEVSGVRVDHQLVLMLNAARMMIFDGDPSRELRKPIRSNKGILINDERETSTKCIQDRPQGDGSPLYEVPSFSVPTAEVSGDSV